MLVQCCRSHKGNGPSPIQTPPLGTPPLRKRQPMAPPPPAYPQRPRLVLPRPLHPPPTGAPPLRQRPLLLLPPAHMLRPRLVLPQQPFSSAPTLPLARMPAPAAAHMHAPTPRPKAPIPTQLTPEVLRQLNKVSAFKKRRYEAHVAATAAVATTAAPATALTATRLQSPTRKTTMHSNAIHCTDSTSKENALP